MQRLKVGSSFSKLNVLCAESDTGFEERRGMLCHLSDPFSDNPQALNFYGDSCAGSVIGRCCSECESDAVRTTHRLTFQIQNLDRAWTYLNEGSRFGQEALVDLLKLSFNIMVHSGLKKRSNGQVASSQFNSLASEEPSWDPRFQRCRSIPVDHTPCEADLGLFSVFEALLRLLHNLPKTLPSPLQSPLTYVLHNLINVPADDPLGSMWMSPYPEATTRGRYGLFHAYISHY